MPKKAATKTKTEIENIMKLLEFLNYDGTVVLKNIEYEEAFA